VTDTQQASHQSGAHRQAQAPDARLYANPEGIDRSLSRIFRSEVSGERAVILGSDGQQTCAVSPNIVGALENSPGLAFRAAA
jgi:hypothetical protein